MIFKNSLIYISGKLMPLLKYTNLEDDPITLNNSKKFAKIQTLKIIFNGDTQVYRIYWHYLKDYYINLKKEI